MSNDSHKNDKGTLVILSPGFPEDEADTTCLPPIQQFCILAKQEFPRLNFVVIAFQYPFTKGHYQWNGIEVFSMGGKNRSKLLRILTWLRVKTLLRKLHRERDLKGILSLWVTETALVGRSFARSKKLKFFAWSQGQDAKKENGYVFRSGVKPSEVIAISDFNAKEFMDNHRIKPFMVAPNGINRNIFPELNIMDRDIDVLGVGSLIPLKNHEAFVRTVHALKKTHPHINAVIVGSGEEERTLTDLINRLGLNHNLKLVGTLPHAQVLAIMNRSRILLHPSTYEGMSTVILEALYSGCHVVSFQGLGEKEIGHLEVVSTESQLLNTCNKLLSFYQKSERVLVYDMRETARRIVSLYT